MTSSNRSIDQLVELVARGGQAAVGALDELVVMGRAAAEGLMTIVERDRGRGPASKILTLLDVPDRVALLEPLALHEDLYVRNAAILALARTGDPRATSLLAAVHAKAPYQRETILTALGDLGGAEALRQLRSILVSSVGDPTQSEVLADLTRRAAEDLDPTDLLSIAAAAQSLAKLGDFSLVGPARQLTEFHASEEFSLACTVRLAAVEALDVSVAPGIAAVFDRCCDDPDPEVAAAAMRATLRLGRVRSGDRWLSLYTNPDREDVYPAHICLQQFTGEPPPKDTREAVLWWDRWRGRFAPDICYRLGKPASPASLVALARGNNSATARTELRHMTGLTFITPSLTPPASAETDAIDAWWSAHASAFSPGQLHRWGRTYAPDACD